MCCLDFSKTKANIHPTYVLKPSVCSCQAFWLSRLEKHPAVLWDGSCGIAVQTGITAAPCRTLPASAGYCWHHVETRRLQGWIGASMHSHQLFFSWTKGTTKSKWQNPLLHLEKIKEKEKQSKQLMVAYATKPGLAQGISSRNNLSMSQSQQTKPKQNKTTTDIIGNIKLFSFGIPYSYHHFT